MNYENRNKYKILIAINIILLFSLIVCIFFLTRKDTVKEIVIELLDGMIKETQDDFSKHFKYYESAYSSIKKDIDSFYVLINQENTPQLMNYYDKKVNNSQETKMIFNTLNSIKDKQSQDFVLMSKLMEYRFIKKEIESEYLTFYWFTDVGSRVFSKKDTIQMGEEYLAKIICTGMVFNKEKQSIMVLNGDTLNADDGGIYTFKERPQKRGLVVHEGHITCFHPVGGIVELQFGFRYYVK